ncbi:serine O-acetyltransferase [Jatrophihabitans fulvus]
MERGLTPDGGGLVALLRSDIEAATHPNFRQYGAVSYWTRALGKAAVNPALRAVVTHRVAHALAARGLGPLAMLLRARSVRRTGAEIHPRATIGPGLFLVHSTGVVIGPDVVIGARARIHQGVTLGEPVHLGDGRWGSSTVGDDVEFGAHAVVVGLVTIGDRARIGANAVVTKDVPAGATVVGVPAKPVV